VFPSKDYWKSLDIDIQEVLGNIGGPKRRRGRAGWTTDELELALSLTKERQALPQLPRKSLLRWLERKAPQTVGFLTLLAAFAGPVSPRVFSEVAQEANLENPPARKRSLALLLFAEDREYLVTVQIRTLVGTAQATHSFAASKTVSKSGLLTEEFQHRLVEGLAAALGEPPENIQLDHPHASAQEDEVTYGILYRGPRTWKRDWRKSHWDYPVLKAVLRIYPKSRFLELYSRKRNKVEALARAVGQIVLDDPDGYHALSDQQVMPGEGAQTLPGGQVRITEEQLRRIEAENITIPGAPSVTLKANDLHATLADLKTRGLRMADSEVAREVRVFYTCDGVGGETSVLWDRRSGQTTYKPVPKSSVKRAILTRIRSGTFGEAASPA
jgi:hypothetical protein